MDTKVICITGTSRGIGKYLVEYYTSLGYQVIGCSRSNSDISLKNYEHIIADICIESEVKGIISHIKKKYGRLDVLINNAGIAVMNHLVLTPADTVDRIFSVNVKGTFLTLREAAKIMIPQRHGRIVNFTTIATPLKLAGEAVYAASKAAVISLTQILAHELGEYGITVNAVGPTVLNTDLTRNLPAEKLNTLLNKQAIKRSGTFKDVSNIIDFYIDDNSDFITGQTIYMGGIS